MPGPFNSAYTGTWARYSDRAQALRHSSLYYGVLGVHTVVHKFSPGNARQN